MGHYDDCRPGYCGVCGAAPGNLIDGKCQFCVARAPNKNQRRAARRAEKQREAELAAAEAEAAELNRLSDAAVDLEKLLQFIGYSDTVNRT